MKGRILSKKNVEEIKEFVRQSCRNCNGKVSPVEPFHEVLVEHYFQARNVKIDYKKKNILADIPMGANQFTTVNFECMDLPTFLSSCVRNDHRSMQIYETYIKGNPLVKVDH